MLFFCIKLKGLASQLIFIKKKRLELTANDSSPLLMEEMLNFVEYKENVFLQLISTRNFISNEILHLFKSSGERKKRKET
jgi:hypothetical protein